MSDLILPVSSVSLPLPLPQTDVVVRPGTLDDVPFLDALQKLHTKQVGWMPTQQFVGKIKLGHVLIAEERVDSGKLIVDREEQTATSALPSSSPSTINSSLSTSSVPVGYCIGNDQYFKRDDVGIIYQMNVLLGKQRAFVGAMLLRAMFERSAYGCKLFCCWCAQDIAANRFWEAMGFVPLTFRAGSEKKARTHIFWQKRIRQGDVTTPWWFPSKTAGGSIREDRIVLPIPPGTHWSDAKPMIFPELLDSCRAGFNPPSLPDETRLKRGGLKPALRKKALPPVEPPKPVRRNGLMFDIPQANDPLPETIKPAKQPKAKPEKLKRVCDPRLVSAARELRDRWLERINAAPLPGGGKYEVSRSIENATRVEVINATHVEVIAPQKLLAA